MLLHYKFLPWHEEYKIQHFLSPEKRSPNLVKLDNHGATFVYPEPGSIVTNYDNTRQYRVNANGSVSRIKTSV